SGFCPARGIGQPQAGGAAGVDPAPAAAAQRVDPHPGRAGAAARVVPRLVGQNQGGQAMTEHQARSPGTGGRPGTGQGARERVLRRVRTAIGDDVADRQRRVDAEYAALPRDYLAAHHEPAAHDIVALFAERAPDCRAVVERVPASALPDAIARVLAGRAATFGPAVPPAPEPPPAPE